MPGRVAIVSSYNEECGAAYYSSRLLKHLTAAGYTVEIKRLPLSLLRVHSPALVRRKGDREIQRIAHELKEFETVYLQFEPGLYGSRERIAYRRVLHLLKASRQVVITVHGFDRRIASRFSPAATLHNLTRGRLFAATRGVLEGGVDPAIETFWNYVRKSSHVKVMTFNRGDQILLQRFFDLTRIANYPICYFDQEEVAEIRHSIDRERFLTEYGLDPTRKYFAVCGFFAPYKGHLTAMKALEFLPEDWHLVIVGGEHPHGLEADKDIGRYVRQLMTFPLAVDKQISFDSNLEIDRGIGDLKRLTNMNPLSAAKSLATDTIVRSDHLYRRELRDRLFKFSEFKYFFPSSEIKHRIHYLGQATDEDMPRFYSALDYMVHPYMKTKSGQSGSGPATLAIEFGARALYSNAPVFREMHQYFEGGMQFFNIGNFMELADQLRRFGSFEGRLAAKRATAYDAYNPKGMIEAYRALADA
jgi:glycosyltransferase involved in cell wall biosynthesis